MSSVQRRLKPYSASEPVVFMHIPKCAGTSFIKLLRRWYGPEYHHLFVHKFYDELHAKDGKRSMLPTIPLKLANGEWDPSVKVIHAHFHHGRGFGLPYHLPDARQYFAFMRDPFDMVVSMYFFCKGKSSRGEFWYNGKKVDIRDAFADCSAYCMKHHDWLENHLPQDMTVENCEEYVAEKFVYLGLFDRLAESIDNLAFVLGKPKAELEVQNKSVYDEPIPQELREETRNRYPLAVKLYEVAKKTYQLPNFDPAMLEPRNAPNHRRPPRKEAENSNRGRGQVAKVTSISTADSVANVAVSTSATQNKEKSASWFSFFRRQK